MCSRNQNGSKCPFSLIMRRHIMLPDFYVHKYRLEHAHELDEKLLPRRGNWGRGAGPDMDRHFFNKAREIEYKNIIK